MSIGGPIRLAAMPGIRARRTCALALAACALALTACGGDEEGTIPQEPGQQLLAQLQAVRQAIDSGQCDAAQASAVELATNLSALPEDVDPAVRAALVDAGANLTALAGDPTQCEEPDVGTTDVAEPTTTTETTTTETTTDEEPEEPDEEPEDDSGGEPPADTPGKGDPGGPKGDGEGCEGGSSGGIGAEDG